MGIEQENRQNRYKITFGKMNRGSMIQADIVLALAFGDEGKGKITNELIKKGNYTHCLRFAGGANAGHTIYIKNKKVITHSIPTGALHGVKSIIGPGCVLNEKLFLEELEYLKEVNPNIQDFVKIAYNTHITTDAHIAEELEEKKIGTTKKGIGPTYRDKYARTGIRAESIPSLQKYLIDIYAELHTNDVEVLCEGAQALGLDIDLGDYPYVTSSHCGVGSVLNNGIPHNAIRNVIGVAKCYDTYVGSKVFQNTTDSMLNNIAKIGDEFGATTGRKRQTNYLNLNTLIKYAQIAAPNIIYFNKIDILDQVNTWKIIQNNEVIDLNNKTNFKNTIIDNIKQILPDTTVSFSGTPYGI